MWVCAPCACPLEPWLVLNHHVGPGTQTWVLFQSFRHSQPRAVSPASTLQVSNWSPTYQSKSHGQVQIHRVEKWVPPFDGRSYKDFMSIFTICRKPLTNSMFIMNSISFCETLIQPNYWLIPWTLFYLIDIDHPHINYTAAVFLTWNTKLITVPFNLFLPGEDLDLQAIENCK